MKTDMMKIILNATAAIALILVFMVACNTTSTDGSADEIVTDTVVKVKLDTERVKIKIGTFLGNNERNYYGDKAPERLDLLWKLYLGKGKTFVSSKLPVYEWQGAGWTGQPLIITEDSTDYLIQGAYDHHLKKINLETHEIVWQYKYDDVIKGTATIWENKNAKEYSNKYVVMQGSRLGFNNRLGNKNIPSFRAVSLLTGKELWRHNSKRTRSYSRDVDASALVHNDTAYIGLENGLFTVFNPDCAFADSAGTELHPKIYQQDSLFKLSDIKEHGGNLVTESSPAKLGNRIYIASGSGHIYGYNLLTKKIDWDFFTGSDIDGSPVVTNDSCIIVTIEKQYIDGQGGVFKLDPSKNADAAVVWYFPTKNEPFVGLWDGGVIGSVAVNDFYNKSGKYKNLAAFMAIDGYLYVVEHDKLRNDTLVTGPNNIHQYKTPKLIYSRAATGPSISTPIIVDNKLVAAGYNGIYLFEFDENHNFYLLDKKKMGEMEATPIAYNGNIYIASRDGYLYCMGNDKNKALMAKASKDTMTYNLRY